MAAQDPVAPRAEPIMAHMNADHEDSMLAIVCMHVASLPRLPSQVRMTDINSKGYTLEYKVTTNWLIRPAGDTHSLHVSFDPPVEKAADVRARLVDMSNDAMSKRPRGYPVTYSMPRDLIPWIFVHAALIAMGQPGTATLAMARIGQDGLGRTLETYASSFASRLGGPSVAWLLYKFLAGAHIAEAIAMAGYCFHRGASLPITIQWVITHFFVGFPTYFHFKKVNPEVPGKKAGK